LDPFFTITCPSKDLAPDLGHTVGRPPRGVSTKPRRGGGVSLGEGEGGAAPNDGVRLFRQGGVRLFKSHARMHARATRRGGKERGRWHGHGLFTRSCTQSWGVLPASLAAIPAVLVKRDLLVSNETC